MTIEKHNFRRMDFSSGFKDNSLYFLFNFSFLLRTSCGGHGEQDKEHPQRDLLRQDEGHRQRSPLRSTTRRGQKDERPSSM